MIPEWHEDCSKCEYDPEDCNCYERCEWHDRIMRRLDKTTYDRDVDLYTYEEE